MTPIFPTLEGATPIDDASGLKLKITTLEQLYEAEAHSIANAMLKYLASKPSKRMAPFNVEWMLKLHKQMYDSVWQWAGEIRASNPNIGVPSYQIRAELQNMLADWHCWQDTDMDIFEQAVRLHHRAVWIHPFVNGNGRWARMLCNILLKQHDLPPIAWPAEMNRTSPIRKAYIEAVKEADKGNFVPLIDIHRQYHLP